MPDKNKLRLGTSLDTEIADHPRLKTRAEDKILRKKDRLRSKIGRRSRVGGRTQRKI